MECKALVTFVKSDTGGLLFGSGGGAGVESVKRKSIIIIITGYTATE